ncbi:hypothetical protein [Engelhardtia mirabilis]|uniref:Uncharacterized protein n=1 Tax=Engelhardtia mirabilis TaxID=2528011 RepID=A0A518BJB1_9BACT|nr:hypothetical protein Pla133_21110 [Planctomycetes bacterium Pla133]QDV01360.1 hypothetical protein Pla86_21110 [Planctomycetes bacterium Pla86]
MKRKPTKAGPKPLSIAIGVAVVATGVYLAFDPDAKRPAGDAQSLLSWMIEKPRGPQNELVEDANRFDEFFTPVHVGPELQDMTLGADLLGAVVDGATLTFGPGVFRVDLSALLATPDRPAADLTVQGAGKDETLLLLSDLRANAAIERLTLRDCTIDTEGHDLFSYSHGCGTMTIADARVVGFDHEAEEAAVFHMPCGMLRVSDTEFLGGFGPAPGSGAIFSVLSGALMARFDRCTFRDTYFSSAKLRTSFTLHFQDCHFESSLDHPSETVAGFAGITLVGTSVEPRPPGRDQVEQRSIDELFPDWQTRAIH